MKTRMKTKLITVNRDDGIDGSIEKMQSLGFVFDKAESIERRRIRITFLEPSIEIRLGILRHTLFKSEKRVKEAKKRLEMVRDKLRKKHYLIFLEDFIYEQKKIEKEIKKLQNENYKR